MKNHLRASMLLGAAIMIFAAGATDASACAVCYGDPDSPLVHGARAGVLFMGGVVYTQLLMMVGVGIYWFMRARKLERLEAAAEETPEAN